MKDSIPASIPISLFVFGRVSAAVSNTEYVLDAQTTKNIGVENLDKIRAGKGLNLENVFREMKYIKEPRTKLADGGAVAGSLVLKSESGNPSPQTSGNQTEGLKVYVINNTYENADGSKTKETEIYLDSPQGKKKIESIVEENIYRNKKGGRIPVALDRVNKGQG